MNLSILNISRAVGNTIHSPTVSARLPRSASVARLHVKIAIRSATRPHNKICTRSAVTATTIIAATMTSTVIGTRISTASNNVTTYTQIPLHAAKTAGNAKVIIERLTGSAVERLLKNRHASNFATKRSSETHQLATLFTDRPRAGKSLASRKCRWASPPRQPCQSNA